MHEIANILCELLFHNLWQWPGLGDPGETVKNGVPRLLADDAVNGQTFVLEYAEPVLIDAMRREIGGLVP